MENQLRRGTNVPTDMAPGSVAVGSFGGMAAAEEAIHELAATGFGEENITVAALDNDIQKEIVNETEADALTSSSVATGAVGGKLIEGLARLIGGKRGAANMVYSSLIHLGFSESQAKYYETEYESGRILVVVEGGTRAEEARAILVKHGSALEPSLNADVEPQVTIDQPISGLQAETTYNKSAVVAKPRVTDIQPETATQPGVTVVGPDVPVKPRITTINPDLPDEVPASAVGPTVIPGISTDPSRTDEVFPAQF